MEYIGLIALGVGLTFFFQKRKERTGFKFWQGWTGPDAKYW